MKNILVTITLTLLSFNAFSMGGGLDTLFDITYAGVSENMRGGTKAYYDRAIENIKKEYKDKYGPYDIKSTAVLSLKQAEIMREEYGVSGYMVVAIVMDDPANMSQVLSVVSTDPNKDKVIKLPYIE